MGGCDSNSSEEVVRFTQRRHIIDISSESDDSDSNQSLSNFEREEKICRRNT